MNVHETTVISLGALLVVIPVGLCVASMIFERKITKEEQEVQEKHCCCHECCGCQGCVEEECGCCGLPLSECECGCTCHEH